MRTITFLPRVGISAAFVWFRCAQLPLEAGSLTAPGEVVSLSWCPGEKSCLAWPPIPGAGSYDVYRGGAKAFAALLTTATDSCREGTYSSTTTEATLVAAPAPGGLFWYLVTASDEGGEGPAGTASAGPHVLNAPGACLSGCTLEGQDCYSTSDCCSGVCYEGLCHHACADNGAICASDGECCGGTCFGGTCRFPCKPDGDRCLGAGGLCCSRYCQDGICQAHCTPDGGACTAPGQCCGGYCYSGICTSGCIPNGGYCSYSFQCCSGTCYGGVCRQSCSPPGVRCTTPSQCCSYYCYNGYCY